MRKSALMFIVLGALTCTRVTESGDPENLLHDEGVDRILWKNDNADAKVGLPFDAGTEGEWCDKASARLESTRKVGSIKYVTFTIVKENCKGVEDEKIDMNMIECLTTEKPIYVVRFGTNGYSAYYERVPVIGGSSTSDEEPTNWVPVRNSGQTSKTEGEGPECPAPK